MSEEQQVGVPSKKPRVERKLNGVETETLISEVQTRPCLWNDRHEDFKNTTVCRKLWNEVGAVVNLSGDEAKRKWKNIKDKYRKLLQKPPPKSGSAAGAQKPKWQFFDMMQFTKYLLTPAPMIGNLSSSTQVNAEDEDEVEEEDDFGTQNTEETEDIIQESTNSFQNDAENDSTRNIRSEKPHFRTHRAKGTLIAKQNMEKKMLELEEKKISAILSMGKNNEMKVQQDDDYHFVISLLPYMKSLPSLEKLELRGRLHSEVLQTYKKYELQKRGAENYNYFRPQSNESSTTSTIDDKHPGRDTPSGTSTNFSSSSSTNLLGGDILGFNYLHYSALNNV